MKRYFIHISSLINAIIIFMFIPFLSNFLIGKIGVLATSIIMPLYGIINFITSITIGNLADIWGKYETFVKIQALQIFYWFILVILVFFKLYLIFALFYVFTSTFSVILNSTTGSYLYSMAKNEEEIKKYNTINYIMFNIGVFLGPVIGGLVFENYNFWVLLCYLTFIIVQYFVFKILFESEKIEVKKFNIINNIKLTKNLISSKFNLLYYVLLIIIGIIWVGVYDSVMPTYFIQKHQSLNLFNFNLNSHELVSFTLLINGILLIIITGVVNHLLRHIDVWIKYFLIIIILICSNLVFYVPSPLVVIIAIIGISFAEVIMPQSQTQIIYLISNETNRAQYLSFFASATMLSISFANVFIFLITKTNMQIVATILLGLGICALILVFSLIILYKKHLINSK